MEKLQHSPNSKSNISKDIVDVIEEIDRALKTDDSNQAEIESLGNRFSLLLKEELDKTEDEQSSDVSKKKMADVEPKFRIGDKVKRKEFPYLSGEIWEIHQVAFMPITYGFVCEDNVGYYGPIYRVLENDIELLEER